MRILAFYPYIPFPMDRGAYYRGFHLLRELARTHDVDLVALSEQGAGVEHESVFTEFCRRVEFIPFQHPSWEKLLPERLLNPLPSTVAHWTVPHVGQALARCLAATPYDAVHIFDIILAQYLLDSRTRHRLPLVADRTRVDLQYQVMERERMPRAVKTSLLGWENLLKLWLYEKRVARRCRLQVVCGPDDEAFLRRHVDRDLEIAVIPNGIDATYFHPGAAPEASRSVQPAILFCGAMDYTPNVDALRWYFAEMHQALVQAVPGLEVWIVGKDPTAEVKAYVNYPRVKVTGAVPDVRPYYRRAWLQIVPLRIGGGTRLKIVESMGLGTPVVSTTVGAQGLGLKHDRDILLADTAPDFILQTARALANEPLRRALEQTGVATVRSRLCWPMLGRQLVELYSRRLESQGDDAQRPQLKPVLGGAGRS